MPDPNDHGAMIAEMRVRVDAQQRDIDNLDDDVERMEDSFGEWRRRIETKIDTLIEQNATMRENNAALQATIRTLKWVISLLLGIGALLSALFSGVFTPHH